MINLGKLGRAKREEARKKKEQECREICNRWDSVNGILEMPGWALILREIQKEFEAHNSIYNADSEALEQERGYCNGLQFPLQFVESCKRRALKAQEYLDTLAKQKE